MTKGRVIIVDGYSKGLFLANPNTLFAFDDNLQKVGFAGQSLHARGLKNTVGIPTKHSPVRNIFDSEVDADLEWFKGPLIRPFVTLREHLRAGKNIGWPKQGIGTDEISRLYITAPRLLLAIEAMRDRVFSEAISITHETYQS